MFDRPARPSRRGAGTVGWNAFFATVQLVIAVGFFSRRTVGVALAYRPLERTS